MKALFVERDPVTRGLIRCLTSIVGLDCAIVPSGHLALTLSSLPQDQSEEPWTDGVPAGDDVGVIVMDPDADRLADEVDLVERMRRTWPRALVFAHTHPDKLETAHIYDRVFFKPSGIDTVVRAAQCVTSAASEFDILRHCFGGEGNAA